MDALSDHKLTVSDQCWSELLDTPPDIDCLPTLKQDYPQALSKINQLAKHLCPGVLLLCVRRLVDEPGIRIPRENYSRRNPMSFKNPALRRCCWIIVFDTQEARPLTFLRCPSWVAQNAENLGIDTTVQWRNLGCPAAPVAVLKFVNKLIDRRYVSVHLMGDLAGLESFFSHATHHGRRLGDGRSADRYVGRVGFHNKLRVSVRHRHTYPVSGHADTTSWELVRLVQKA